MKKILLVLKQDVSLSNFRESFFLWIANHLPRSFTSDAVRALALKLAGLKIHYPAHIWAPLEVRPIGAAARIAIGRDTFINSRVRFAAREPATIEIGERVFIGPDCFFETVNHALIVDEAGSRPVTTSSIVVKHDVWLGARVTVLPGVTIGEYSVVAAGAVVTSDVPAYSLIAGVPAKVIRSLA